MVLFQGDLHGHGQFALFGVAIVNKTYDDGVARGECPPRQGIEVNGA